MINNKYVKIISLILIIFLVLGVFFIKKYTKSVDEVENNTQEVEIYSNNTVVKMINFTAEGCMPCKQMEILMRELKNEYSGIVEILELDIYEYSNLSSKYSVMYTPTQVFLNSDDEIVETHVGFLGKSKIKDIMKKYGVEI